MDTKVEQLPRDFIAARHVARVAIQLANIGKSTPENELSRAWRLIEVARGMVRNHAAFVPVSTESPKVSEKPEPEFLSLPGPGKRCPISGLSRSTLYELAGRGKIRMISLRREGNSRGKRLVSVESVRHYLRTLDGSKIRFCGIKVSAYQTILAQHLNAASVWFRTQILRFWTN